MKTACVLIPNFAVKCEMLRRPEIKGRQCILVSGIGSKRAVFDSSESCPDLMPGMSLREALALCKTAVLLEADVPYYHQSFEHVLDSLEQRCPVVEAENLGCAYVGLDGLEELYGGEGRLLSSLSNSIPAHYSPQIGVSNGKFPAFVAALKAGRATIHKASTDLKQFLRGVPADFLPVPWEVKNRLRSYGLSTLGTLADLPVGPLQSQFGPLGRLMWELANGIDGRPVVARGHVLQVTERLTFPAPTVSMEPILAGVDRLLGRAFSRLEMRGRFARTARLAGQALRGVTWERDLSFKEPAGSRTKALFVIKHSLESVQLPGPLEDISLTLTDLTGESGRQENMFLSVRKREQLGEAIRSLEARLNIKHPILQVVEVEPWSRIPERRKGLIPYAP